MEDNKKTEDYKNKKTPDPRSNEDLFSAFKAADTMVMKKYVTELSQTHCIEAPDQISKIEVGSNVYLYHIESIVYDKNENIQDKLTTVYSTVLSLSSSTIVMLLNGQDDKVDLYLGVVDKCVAAIDYDNLKDSAQALQNVLKGNFPGTKTKKVLSNTNGEEKGQSDTIEDIMKDIKCVVSVSSIPELRNENEHKSHEFVQGLEKLVETMRGKTYAMFVIADAVGNNQIEDICVGYEDIYAQLAPFRQSVQTINESTSEGKTNSIIEGITNTTNESVAKAFTRGTITSNTVGVNTGIHGGIPVFGGYLGGSYTHNKGNSENDTETTTHGTAKSLTEQNSVANSLTDTTGESLQITYENRAVKTLLDRIDEQIQRLRTCEDFGMFDTCAYFVSEDYSTAVAAASTFKSITRGEKSSVEASAVNIWNDDEDVKAIKVYLERFYHPIFRYKIDEKHDYALTPSLMLSGRELSYQMALPKKSVRGLPVVECIEFGRDVISLDKGKKGNIELGNIFHMREEEDCKVKLNKNNLTSHTFITGSTGAGKSNTVFRLLNNINSPYLVIEPAKGEYKDVFGGNSEVEVYGTNPKFTKLLRIDPFSFPKNIAVNEHIDRLVEIFNVCWPMYAAMPVILKEAVIRAYKSVGWNMETSENNYYNGLYPTFNDILREIRDVLKESEYSSDNKSDYTGALVTRLKSLTNGINGQIFTSNSLSNEELFDKKVIVDLSRVGSTETKSMIMSLLVMKLQEYRLSDGNPNTKELKHITVLEEAHNILKRTSTEQLSESSNLLGKSVEMLANSIAELRAFGEGFIIADQSPGLLDMSVIRNTNTKIIHKLPDFSDRELVGKSAGLNDEQIKELAKLELGVAAVYQHDWIDPVLCKVNEFKQENKKKYNKKIEPNNKEVSLETQKSIIDIVLKPHENVTLDLDKFIKADIDASAKIAIIKYLQSNDEKEKVEIIGPILNKEYIVKSIQTLNEETLKQLTDYIRDTYNINNEIHINFLIWLELLYQQRITNECEHLNWFQQYMKGVK